MILLHKHMKSARRASVSSLGLNWADVFTRKTTATKTATTTTTNLNVEARTEISSNELSAKSKSVLRVFNSLSQRTEPLQPDLTTTKGMAWYTCGPTTYAPAHLGHARTYVCLDILRRVLEHQYHHARPIVDGISGHPPPLLKYIDKLADTYKRLFNEDPPKGYKTPHDKNDHPELDTSEILEGDMAAKYLTMVGQLQWLVTLGRFDIYAQVATMSRFRAAPRQGHMDRLKKIYSYAIMTKDYAIRFRTEQPDYSFLPDQDFDWTYSVYGDVHEILPDDMPEPLGEAVTTTTTMDANLNHCLASGKSLTGCLHFVNKTPVDWYSKKQATVETATYGSEFVAAKTATEQIMDIRQTLRYLSAPITTKSFLFGDNRSVVTSATLSHSTLTKRHNILVFHRVREAIAVKLMAFYWIQSAYNLSDMLSKHWDHPTVYPMILKLLITRGNTTLIPREATQEKEKRF